MLRAVAILVTPDFLPQLKVCIESIKQHEPELPICVAYFGADYPENYNPDNVYFYLQGEVAEVKELYKQRPRFILDLLRDEYSQVLHIGADVVFYQPFVKYMQRYAGCDAALSPHITSPIKIEDELFPNDFSVYRTGPYNSDFTIWNDFPDTRNFLLWQYQSLCKVNDDKYGYFFDQTYLAMAPCFMDTEIITDVGINVAYYNLHENLVEVDRDGEYIVTNQGRFVNPLICFQFTGYETRKPARLSKFHKREKQLTSGILSVTLDYAKRLELAGCKDLSEAK
jgi:hypothetical protein